MEKKWIIVLIIVFVVIAVLGTVFVLFSNRQQDSNKQSEINALINTFPASKQVEVPKTDSVTVPAQQGQQVEIKNPYENAVRVIDSHNVVLTEKPAYQILYFHYPDGESFLISILNPDLENTRQTAESELISKLGISKEQACNLNVSVSVSKDASVKAAGQNYGLSFCPDGKPFPK